MWSAQGIRQVMYRGRSPASLTRCCRRSLGFAAADADNAAGVDPVGVDDGICMEYGIRRDLCAGSGGLVRGGSRTVAAAVTYTVTVSTDGCGTASAGAYKFCRSATGVARLAKIMECYKPINQI